MSDTVTELDDAAQLSSAPDAGWSMSARAVASGAVRRCLDAQTLMPRLGVLARMVGRDPLAAEARPWFVEAVAASRVASVLERLAPEWTVLHAVPAGVERGDIDHLLIGPGGVIALTTKRHVRGRTSADLSPIVLAGHRERFIPRALAEREDAATRLSVALSRRIEVISAIVIVDADNVDSVVADVPVVSLDNLLTWIDRCERVVSPREASEIATVALRSDTWRMLQQQELPHADDSLAFGALRTQVRRADLRRSVWHIGGFSAAGTAFVVAIAVGLPTALFTLVVAALR